MGALTRSQLRGSTVRRLFQGVYALRNEPMTHDLRCMAAALALPPETVITGKSVNRDSAPNGDRGHGL